MHRLEAFELGSELFHVPGYTVGAVWPVLNHQTLRACSVCTPDACAELLPCFGWGWVGSTLFTASLLGTASLFCVAWTCDICCLGAVRLSSLLCVLALPDLLRNLVFVGLGYELPCQGEMHALA